MAVAAHALTLSPGSLTLMAGGSGTISLSSVSGTASLVGNSAPAVASATLASNKITVKALAVGTTKLTVKDGKETRTATVTVKLPMTVVAEQLVADRRAIGLAHDQQPDRRTCRSRNSNASVVVDQPLGHASSP